MGFKEEIIEFSEVVNELQSREEREHIEDVDAIAAINVLNFAKYRKVPDIFLACAAYNLLNAYVKQKDSGLSCQFHNHIHDIIKGIEDVDQPESIKLSFDNSEKKALLIISFWDFQFSFQSIGLTEPLRALLTEPPIPWDGIRKQKCAATIFYFALNSAFLSNKTLGGSDLRNFIEDEITEFENGGYKIKAGRFIKTKNLNPAKDDDDYYLKNHIREKLYDCQDRPVIISGVFRKAWGQHVTFTSIKPYIAHTRVITICDHINLYREDLERCFDLNNLVFGKRYCIIGYCRPYHNDRMGVNLAVDEGFTPIFRIDEYEKMPKEILARCHRFSIEEYLSSQQKKLKL